MIKNFNSKWLPYAALLAGGVGALLRLWLYGTGLDGEDLLSTHHPAGYLVLILTLAVIAAGIWQIRFCAGREKFSHHFPASAVGCAGAMAGSFGLLITAMVDLIRRDTSLALISGFVGIVAAAALAMVGWCRLKGRRPGLAYHSVLCVYFILRLISRYQLWSSDPQLHDYAFQLLATVCAMLFSYHWAALDMQPRSRKRLSLLGLLGVYFCCLSLVRSDGALFYLGLGAWMLTNLGSLEAAAQEEV